MIAVQILRNESAFTMINLFVMLVISFAFQTVCIASKNIAICTSLEENVQTSTFSA